MVSYKIGEIEAITGIKAHTIRIWEKRYDLLLPNRSATDMRKYTDEDLRYLLNVAILNKSGYKISKISKFSSKQLEKVVIQEFDSDDVTKVVDRLIIHIIDLNQNQFVIDIENQIQKIGFDECFHSVMVPFLNKIGNMWQSGSLTTSKEYFSTNLIRQIIMRNVTSLRFHSKSENSIILFLSEHESHDIELLYYYHKLRETNIKTYYLGQHVPYHALCEFIERTGSDTLITNWVTGVDERNMINYFKKLKRDKPNVEIYSGGNQVLKYQESLVNLTKPINTRNYLEILERLTV